MKNSIVLIGIIILATLSYYGFQYYNDTYNANIGYAVVPENIPEKKKMKDLDGKEVSGMYIYEYNLNFIMENGQKKQMHFNLSGINPSPLEPKSYIKAEISKKRVVKGPNKISESEIPKNLMEHLNK